jgi:hypothetical protein
MPAQFFSTAVGSRGFWISISQTIRRSRPFSAPWTRMTQMVPSPFQRVAPAGFVTPGITDGHFRLKK